MSDIRHDEKWYKGMTSDLSLQSHLIKDPPITGYSTTAVLHTLKAGTKSRGLCSIMINSQLNVNAIRIIQHYDIVKCSSFHFHLFFPPSHPYKSVLLTY